MTSVATAHRTDKGGVSPLAARAIDAYRRRVAGEEAAEEARRRAQEQRDADVAEWALGQFAQRWGITLADTDQAHVEEHAEQTTVVATVEGLNVRLLLSRWLRHLEVPFTPVDVPDRTIEIQIGVACDQCNALVYLPFATLDQLGELLVRHGPPGAARHAFHLGVDADAVQ